MRARFLVAAAIALLASPASAHREPLPIEVWGNFGPQAARCQRRIARAAAGCVRSVWAARRACAEAELHGTPCDRAATDAAIDRARRRVGDAIDAGCTDAEATTLQFLGRFEAVVDARAICAELETALVSAVFGAPSAAVSASLDPLSRACVGAAAAIADATLRFALRDVRAALDAIAALPSDAATRTRQLARTAARRAHAAERFAAGLVDRCPADRFESVYRRTAAELIADVASRAACLAGAAYVQDAAVCPAPVCGNGMIEPGEDCDGSADCPANCVVAL